MATRKPARTKSAKRNVTKSKASKSKPVQKAKAKEPALLKRNCGTMAVHMMLLEMYPSFRARQFQLEQDTAQRRSKAFDLKKLKLSTVRVVVNVVYQTPAQNITLGQIRSQIAALNRDYGATNPDKTKTPTPWKGLVTDSRIRFKLFKVQRKQTTKASFGADDGVKKASAGGLPPLSPEKYLNLWTCPLGGGLLGYAQFPGGPTASDGVVINYRAFGTQGTAQAPFDKGRTATHEIGHFFNLRHIWADTEDCSGSDFVADTPNCAGPNYGKPGFPHVTCNNGPNGDMYVNYMDYTDDGSMFMFTTQQVMRMRSALEGPRKSLMT